MADTTETKTYLINVKDNLDAYAQRAVDAKKAVDDFAKANAELLKQADKNNVEYQKAAAQLRTLETAYKNEVKNVELATKANDANKNSYEELLRRWQLAQVQLKLLEDTMQRNSKGQIIMTDAYKKQSIVVAEAKAGLDAFGKGVHDNRLNVGSYSEAIEAAMGKFSAFIPAGSALGKGMEAGAGGVGVLSKAFKALLANPIVALIAAIAAALFGLIKIFTGTAEGAGKVKDIMASLHAIVDVLRARLVSLIDTFRHVFSGEWRKAGEDLKKTFGGLGEEIATASKAAAELSKQQRQLTKEMRFHISEEADENRMIQEYLMLAKDKTKTDQERTAYLKEAIRLSKEKAEREVEYANRQLDIDIGNAALKGQIDAKVLKDWVSMEAEKQKVALENSAELRAAYNLLGGETIKALEEAYAKGVTAEAEFFQTNKRSTSQLSTLMNEMEKDRIKNAVAAIEVRKIAAKGEVETLIKLRREQLKAELQDSQLTLNERKLMEAKAEEEIAQMRLDQQRKVFEARKVLAKNDTVEMVAILREQFAAEMAATKMSEAERQLLTAQFNDAVLQVEQQGIKRRYDARRAAAKGNQAEELALAKQEMDEMLALVGLGEEQKAILRAQYAAQAKALTDADTAAGFEAQRIKNEYDLAALQTILDAEYGNMLASVEYAQMTANQKLLIDEQYTKASQDLSKARQDQMWAEKAAVADALGAMSEVVGKQTVLGKGFAIAQAVINTWLAASKALADPTMPSTIARIALMVSVIATGMMAVRNIMKVDTSGKGGGAAAGGSAPSVQHAAGLTVQATPPKPQLPQAAQMLAGSPQVQTVSAGQQGVSTFAPAGGPAQPTGPAPQQFTPEDFATAAKAIPPPVVSVEDINAKAQQARKVAVVANI
jgi:hypothetical protein